MHSDPGFIPRHDLAIPTRYAAWANTRIYATLAGVTPGQLTAPTPIFAGSILRTLHHVYLMDVVWKAHLTGVPHGLTTRNPETAPPFGDLREAQMAIDAWYVDYANTLRTEVRNEVVHFEFIGGGAGAMRRVDILLHVINHTTYHRGHVTAMLNLLGIDPPATDLPVFLRDVPQPAE